MNCVLPIPLLGGGIDPSTMGERPIQGLDGEETQFFARVSKTFAYSASGAIELTVA